MLQRLKGANRHAKLLAFLQVSHCSLKELTNLTETFRTCGGCAAINRFFYRCECVALTTQKTIGRVIYIREAKYRCSLAIPSRDAISL